MTNATTLRALLADTSSSPLLIPGGGTPLEVLSIQGAGFPAAYLSGYAIAAWRHGLPDIGLLGAGETAAALTAARRVSGIPLIVDSDTGYGDAASVHANVRMLEAAGAAAIQLEDQVWPKKCGHMVGKEVIPLTEAAGKIRAAVEARHDPDTVIIARTDAVAPIGLDEAIARALAFHEAGADILFIDAPESEEQLEEIGRTLPGILMVNMSEGGLTPALPAERLHELGFRVVIYPTTALRAASRLMQMLFADLKATGGTLAWHDRMHTLDDLNRLVGIEEYLAVGDRATAMS